MANAFSAFTYGTAGSYDALNGGWQVSGAYAGNGGVLDSFPVAGTNVFAIQPTKVGQATCNAIIEVLPTGLQLPNWSRKYFTDSTAAALNTARQ